MVGCTCGSYGYREMYEGFWQADPKGNDPQEDERKEGNFKWKLQKVGCEK